MHSKNQDIALKIQNGGLKNGGEQHGLGAERDGCQDTRKDDRGIVMRSGHL